MMALQALEDIYLMSTTVAGERPGANQLQLGEVAFNVTDQLMFVGKGGGAYITVSLIGGGGGGIPPDGDSIIVSGGTLSVNHLECGTF